MVKDFFRRYWGEIGLALFIYLIFRGSGDPAFSGSYWELWLQKHFFLSQFHAHLVVVITRKTGHLVGYGLQALCLKSVLGKRLSKVSPVGLFWLTWSGVALIAIMDETMQVFSSYRSGVWYDILLDLLGATVFLLAAGRSFSRGLRRKKINPG